MDILKRFKRKRQPRLPAEPQPSGRGKTVPPHIALCKVCEGSGQVDSVVCPQCKGSGRVIVSCEVTTYLAAYVPE